jgi:hypothetical protein
MPETIWKYELETIGEQEIKMPGGAQILCVQMQHGKPCIWAMVGQHVPPRKRKIMTYGTGQRMPNAITKREYIGTYQDDSGFVWHVFDVTYIEPGYKGN